MNVCKKRFPLEEAETKGLELCSLWQENLKDSNWHPLKVIIVDDNPQVRPQVLKIYHHKTSFVCSYHTHDIQLDGSVDIVTYICSVHSWLYMLSCRKKGFIVSVIIICCYGHGMPLANILHCTVSLFLALDHTINNSRAEK